jgi:hypothetical protein
LQGKDGDNFLHGALSPITTSGSELQSKHCERGGATLGRASPHGHQPLSPPSNQVWESPTMVMGAAKWRRRSLQVGSWQVQTRKPLQWATTRRERKKRHCIFPTISQKSTLSSSSRLGSDRMTRCIIKVLSIKEWTLCSRSSRMLQRNPGAQLADNDSPQPIPSMDNQVPPWTEAVHPRSQLFVYFSYSVGGLIYHDDKLDDSISFSYYVCIILSVMAALYMASPSIGRRNLVPANTCNFLYNFCIIFTVMVVLKQIGATCSGFPPVAEQVATRCHCIVDN